MKRPSGAGDEVEGGGGREAEISTANVLVLLSRGGGGGSSEERKLVEDAAGRVFECKTCSRRFPSFQALGGHRASHKKPRVPGEAAAQAASAVEAKPRVHECSVCGLEFPIGQALGGHMRRHRVVADDGGGSGSGEEEERAPKDGGSSGKKRVVGLDLDLNLPPVENDQDVRLLRFELGLPKVVDCLR